MTIGCVRQLRISIARHLIPILRAALDMRYPYQPPSWLSSMLPTYVACGPSKWARHDPPMMPWFMRRNEILVQVCRAGSDGALASLAATKEG